MSSRSAVAALLLALAVPGVLPCAPLSGHVARAAEAARHFTSLGGTLADPTPEAARKAGVPGGVLVVAVDPDGPLAEEEFLKGDVITEFEGRTVSGVDDLSARIARLHAGEMARVRSWRKGRERMLALLTLGPIDAPTSEPEQAGGAGSRGTGATGGDVATLAARIERLEREVAMLRARVDSLGHARAPVRRGRR